MLLFRKFKRARRPSKISSSFLLYLAMNANDGDAHRVDFRLIKQFQKLDPRYSVEKCKKLEQRLITRDVVQPSSNAVMMANKPTAVVRRVRTTKI